MKSKNLLVICAVFCSIFLFLGCSKEDDVLGKMKKMIPLFEGATVVESKVAEEKMAVIMMEVETSKASQKDIFDFYKDTMTKEGWELKKFKDYGKNGSVMELAKEDVGTLSVVTIMKKVEKTGKIPVTVNLAIK
jgi:hypothetical protein